MLTIHDLTNEEIVRRGKDIYERSIRPSIDEATDYGKALVINVANGEYEMADRPLDAADRLMARYKEPPLFFMRVGWPAFAKMGGGWNRRRV
jgi:hypothetical protein